MILSIQPSTFVIALKGHPVSELQLQDCLKSAAHHRWHTEIFWGVNGAVLTADSWEDIGVVPLLAKPTMDQKGSWGCFFSHWKLWHKCVELNEPIVILEHDAVIQNTWPHLDLSESIIKLHAHYKPKKIRIDEHTGNWSTSTHAYCLSPDHAKKLINFARTVGALPADMFMGDKVVSVSHLGIPELVERQNTVSTTTSL